MRVLILGATGMLGHKLVQVLGSDFEVIAARRNPALTFPTPQAVQFVEGVDVRDAASLEGCIAAVRPKVVLNAVGVVKQVMGGIDRTAVLDINALLPNRLADLCGTYGARLVHFSTDCVFSGARDSMRGPLGYRESDPADARDLYGLSKLLGEPEGPHCLTLRTSIIGPELRARKGLLEWFLAQSETTISGYTQALYTGLPTVVVATLVGRLLRDHPTLAGVWQVASDPISKYDLLHLFKESWSTGTRIEPDTEFYCDRRLDGSRFSAETGWRAEPWPELVARMRQETPGN